VQLIFNRKISCVRPLIGSTLPTEVTITYPLIHRVDDLMRTDSSKTSKILKNSLKFNVDCSDIKTISHLSLLLASLEVEIESSLSAKNFNFVSVRAGNHSPFGRNLPFYQLE